jgi:holo-ACP synthase CitX
MPHTAILEARESRWRAKRELARRFRACVVSLCLNIPGPDKNPPDAKQALALLQAALCVAHARALLRLKIKRAAILHEIAGAGADGPYWLMVSPLPGVALKRMAVRLEREHALGRLADIDILTPAGEPLSRVDLGLAPRACFLCGEPAALCRRSNQHPQRMLADFTATLLETARKAADANAPKTPDVNRA